jgi:hypothetical protein
MILGLTTMGAAVDGSPAPTATPDRLLILGSRLRNPRMGPPTSSASASQVVGGRAKPGHDTEGVPGHDTEGVPGHDTEGVPGHDEGLAPGRGGVGGSMRPGVRPSITARNARYPQASASRRRCRAIP